MFLTLFTSERSRQRHAQRQLRRSRSRKGRAAKAPRLKICLLAVTMGQSIHGAKEKKSANDVLVWPGYFGPADIGVIQLRVLPLARHFPRCHWPVDPRNTGPCQTHGVCRRETCPQRHRHWRRSQYPVPQSRRFSSRPYR